MNLRKEIAKISQENVLELNDEALEQVVGGNSEHGRNDWHPGHNHDWNGDWNWRHRHDHDHGWDWRHHR